MDKKILIIQVHSWRNAMQWKEKFCIHCKINVIKTDLEGVQGVNVSRDVGS